MTSELRAALWLKQRMGAGERPVVLTVGGDPRRFLAEGAAAIARDVERVVVVVDGDEAKASVSRDVLAQAQLRIEVVWDQRIRDAHMVVLSSEEFRVRVPEVMGQISALLLASPTVLSNPEQLGLAHASSWSSKPSPWIGGFAPSANVRFVGENRLFTVAGSVVAGLSLVQDVAVEEIP